MLTFAFLAAHRIDVPSGTSIFTLFIVAFIIVDFVASLLAGLVKVSECGRQFRL